MALLSNSGVNWLLFPQAGADVVIFPWPHTWFLLSFGVAGAIVMSLPGTLVQSALDKRSTFALNPEVAHALGGRIALRESTIEMPLESWLGRIGREYVGWYVINWFQNLYPVYCGQNDERGDRRDRLEVRLSAVQA